MKTKAFLFLVAWMPAIAAFAQGPYFGVGGGYGIPVAGTVLGRNYERLTSAGTYSDENVRGSFGSGFHIDGYCGYSFRANVAAELGVNYLFGRKYHFGNDDVEPGITDHSEDEVYVRSLRLAPALRVTIGEGNFRPYLRGGVVIGLANKLTDHYTSTSDYFGTPDSRDRVFEMSGRISAGFIAAAGLNYRLSGNWWLSGEISGNAMSWGPGKGKITKYIVNGSDELPSMTTSQKEFEFVDRVDQSMNSDSSSPDKVLRTYFPMSAAGLTLGIHFSFGS